MRDQTATAMLQSGDFVAVDSPSSNFFFIHSKREMEEYTKTRRTAK